MFKSALLFAVGILFSAFISNAQTWSTKSPNSSNPYDSVGLIHNLGIIYCRDQGSGGGSATDFPLVYVADRYPGFIYDSLVRAVDEGSHAALHDSTNYLPVYLSSTARGFISQLISAIDDIEDSSETDDVTEAIKGIEAEMSATDNLSSSEKVPLLCASSVARYSLNYWKENGGFSFNYRMKNGEIVEDVLAINGISDHTLRDNSVQFLQKFESIQEIELSNIGKESLLNVSDFAIPKGGWLRRLLHTVIGDVVGALAGAAVGWAANPDDPATIVICAIGGAIAGSIWAANNW
jgi:hypothetical protein